MYSFSEQFRQTKEIIDKGLYKDPTWVEDVVLSIKELKGMIPKEYDMTSLADELNQSLWYVEQLLMWCSIPEHSLREELNAHGSILFYYLSSFITPSEEQRYLEQLAEAQLEDSNANHINLLILDDLEKRATKKNKKLTKEEIQIQMFKELEETMWKYLGEDIASWETDEETSRLVKKIGQSAKFNLNKKESLFFIETMDSYVNLGYFDVSSPKKKTELYKEFTKIFGK